MAQHFYASIVLSYASEHHDRKCQRGGQGAQTSTERKAAIAWHLKVCDERVGAFGHNCRHSGRAIRDRDDVETAMAKRERDQFAHVDIIVDHDDARS